MSCTSEYAAGWGFGFGWTLNSDANPAHHGEHGVHGDKDKEKLCALRGEFSWLTHTLTWRRNDYRMR